MTSTRMISNDKSGEKNRPTIDRYRGQIYDVTVSKKKKDTSLSKLQVKQ